MKAGFALATLVLAAPALARDFDKDSEALRAIHARLAPSVVRVDLVQSIETPTRVTLDSEKSGNGLVISGDGWIISDESMVRGGAAGGEVEAVTVTLEGGRRFDASYQGRTELLTFFRVVDPEFDARAVTFAADDQLDVGDFVASVKLAGPSFGHVAYLDAFMISGKVSKPRRAYLTNFGVSDYLGGPVVAFDGRVVGVVGFMKVGEAADDLDDSPFVMPLGFAGDGREVCLIPVEHLRASLQNPPTREERAKQRPPWLGIEVQDLPPSLRRAMRLDASVNGLRVTRVIGDSPAERAGVEVGDVLTSVDGTRFSSDGPENKNRLSNHLERLEPGDLLALVVQRAGERNRMVAKLDARPPSKDEAARSESAPFGVTARDLVLDDREELHLDSAFDGARMTGVRPTGFAGLGGLLVDDVVTAVDGEAVAGAEELCTILARAATERRDQLVLFVLRRRDTMFVHVQPDWAR